MSAGLQKTISGLVDDATDLCDGALKKIKKVAKRTPGLIERSAEELKRYVKAGLDESAGKIQRITELLDPDFVGLKGFGRSIQLDRCSCAAQGTFLVLRYFKKARSIENVTQELGTTEKGTGPAQIRRLMEKRGLKVHRRNRATIEDLRGDLRKERAALLFLPRRDHWVVAYGYSGKDVIYIHDSAPLDVTTPFLCRWSTSDLRRSWDRTALVVWKE